MPKVTIDGRAVEVPDGTTILEAALRLGREIPHYCYHPGLSIAGNCRMCLVDVEKAPKLVIGCYTPVAEGMVVHTDNEKVRRARAAMMEFFLINHPLDCPICDQAGECKLQDYAVEYGDGVSRYTEPKLVLAKAVDIGEHVLLDQERCIQCSRCIRFCDEVTKTGELAFFQRGNHSQIGIHPGKRLDNPYSGNVVDLCPVGALTLKEFRFQTRVWYLKNTPTICAGCSRGCNVVVGVGQQQVLMTTQGQADDRIKRIVPRHNAEVNGYWICDEGRLSFRRQQGAIRLETPQAPAGAEVDYEEALRAAARILAEAASASALGAVLSPRLTCEDIHAWNRLLAALGGAKIAARRLSRGVDDEILIRADKGANSTGARWILGEGATEQALADAIGRGAVRALLVVGDPLDPADSFAMQASLRDKLGPVVWVGPYVAEAARFADVLLPSTAWAEEDGTFVNFEGRAQRLRRCHVPRGEARPGWRICADLAEAAGVAFPDWTSDRDVLADLAAASPRFAGLDAEGMGLLGVPVEGDAATRA